MDSTHTSLELPPLALPTYESTTAKVPQSADSQRYSSSAPLPDLAVASPELNSPIRSPISAELMPVGWEDPAFSQRLLRNLEDFSGAFRASITEQSQLKSELHYTGQQMSQVFGAMSQLLDIMYERMLGPSAAHATRTDPVQSEAEYLQPLTQSLCESIDQGFGEVNRRVHMSEERHLSALEATLQQLQTEREIQNASFLTQVANMRVQTRIECNRLLQVLLMGTMVAAVGAAAAFLILRH